MTVSGYILERLRQLGVDTLFGVVGATCADFFDAALATHFQIVTVTSDLEAGYAADGYARLRGLSVASVSYGPGTLSLINALAGAYVEKSAIVLISGGPTDANLSNERDRGVLFSHSTGRDATDFHVVEQVTAASARIRNSADAPAEIDRVLRVALSTRRPVYLEINKGLWGATCSNPGPALQPIRPASGQEEMLAKQILARLSVARRPALLLGEEIQRYGLQAQTQALLAKLELPWATTVLGKSALSEQIAGFAGTYSGANSNAQVSAVIEQADFLLALGGVFSSGYLALATASADKMARAYDGKVRIDRGTPTPAELGALLEKLTSFHSLESRLSDWAPSTSARYATADLAGALTYAELFTALDGFIDSSFLFIADTSLSITPAANMAVEGRDAFLASAAWASIGHSVGAAVGASFATTRRPLVLCGDGGFQMVATALSTLARHHRQCIVIIIDNGLYGYEQYLLGRDYFRNASQAALPYTLLNRWDYVPLARAMGIPNAVAADSVATLVAALTAARNWSDAGIISVSVQPRTLPQGVPL